MGGESDVRKKNTNWYLHNQWQVGNLYAQQPVKVGESAFGSVLVKNWLWKKKMLPRVEARLILEDCKPYHKPYVSQFELELRGQQDW